MTGVDTEFGKWIITLGVGGILAAMMFFIHRKDAQQYAATLKSNADAHAAALKALSDQILRIADTLLLVLDKNTSAHVANSASNAQLISIVGALHRRMDEDNMESAKSKAVMLSEVIQELCRPGSVFLAALTSRPSG